MIGGRGKYPAPSDPWDQAPEGEMVLRSHRAPFSPEKPGREGPSGR